MRFQSCFLREGEFGLLLTQLHRLKEKREQEKNAYILRLYFSFFQDAGELLGSQLLCMYFVGFELFSLSLRLPWMSTRFFVTCCRICLFGFISQHLTPVPRPESSFLIKCYSSQAKKAYTFRIFLGVSMSFTLIPAEIIRNRTICSSSYLLEYFQ